MTIDVSIESSRSTPVAGECRTGAIQILSGEMDAIVMEEHPSPVGLVRIAVEIGR